MAKEDPYKEARRRVKAKKEFYRHLTTYIIFSVFFFLLNVATGGGVWFIYPVLGWGLGLAGHYVNVFGMPGAGPGSDEWEERELEREMRRLQGKSTESPPEPEADHDHLELRELERQREEQKRRYSEDDLV